MLAAENVLYRENQQEEIFIVNVVHHAHIDKKNLEEYITLKFYIIWFSYNFFHPRSISKCYFKKISFGLTVLKVWAMWRYQCEVATVKMRRRTPVMDN
jgi:hypothetical protein